MFLVLIVLAYSIFAVSPHSTFHLPGTGAIREDLSKAVPQGWGFFTKSPRDPFLLVYANDGVGGHQEIMQLPTVKVENYFGVGRFDRGQPVELANIVNRVSSQSWNNCGPTINSCLDAPLTAVEVHNEKPEPSLCGQMKVVEVAPVPWAYRHLTDARFQAQKAMTLAATCS
ncbi:SdpA family antimicrobial peptide system protein [Arthrobacter methylotrophus]|uniref:SdpA family antimicrobial peptide system protein n=1 Tax=Arthrobacter methylotrophus TaxID=121291 RepID=A0ABV5UQ89_9MICC